METNKQEFWVIAYEEDGHLCIGVKSYEPFEGCEGEDGDYYRYFSVRPGEGETLAKYGVSVEWLGNGWRVDTPTDEIMVAYEE